MEASSESPDSPSHPDKPARACFMPKIPEGTAQFLVNTIAGTAKMVQAAIEAHKSAQVLSICPVPKSGNVQIEQREMVLLSCGRKDGNNAVICRNSSLSEASDKQLRS